jgi:hypothetical protein
MLFITSYSFIIGVIIIIIAILPPHPPPLIIPSHYSGHYC